MSDATFYTWKSKYGGLEVSEAKRLRALEVENAQLKRLLADAMLDNAALKEWHPLPAAETAPVAAAASL
jgi:putative transposase